jgi:hypothetical protein
MSETTLWGMHAGKYGDADSLFFKHNVVALLLSIKIPHLWRRKFPTRHKNKFLLNSGYHLRYQKLIDFLVAVHV